MKRITEVSIVSIIETQPDLSHLGEYTDTPSDWVIVCREEDYIANLEKKAWKEQYQNYLKDDDNFQDWKAQGNSATDWPPSFEDFKAENSGGYELPKRGHEYRFFKPVAGDEKEGSLYHQKYGLQDFERMQSYNQSNWWMLGIKATAKIQTSANGENWLCNEVSSGGLWGIESDSDADYLKDVANEQLSELRDTLKSFGFNNRQIDQAFKNAKEIDGGCDN